jgi:hypothetical protein
MISVKAESKMARDQATWARNDTRRNCGLRGLALEIA